jgi:hypothetical protein
MTGTKRPSKILPFLRISNTTDKDEKISAIVKNLAGRAQSRPRKVATLSNTINSLFTNKLYEIGTVNQDKTRHYLELEHN